MPDLRFIDGVRRTFPKPRNISMHASGNFATLGTDLSKAAEIRLQDELIAHSIGITWTMVAPPAVLGTVRAAVTVNASGNVLGLTSGSLGLGATAGVGMPSVLWVNELAPATVSDLCSSGSIVLDLRQGDYPSGTSWGIYLSGFPPSAFFVSVHAVLLYNSIAELAR